MSKADTPVRYPKGLTNNGPNHPLNKLKNPDPNKVAAFSSDFNTYAAADYVVTVVGSGTSALVAGDGGLLQLTTSAGGTDSVVASKTPANTALATGLQTWFRARIALSDATNSRGLIGLTNAITTLAPTDGFWFNKATAGTSWTFNYAAAASSISLSATIPAAILTAANSTFVVFAAYYDGAGNLSYYVNDRLVGTLAVTALPAVNLTQSMAILNGAAAIKNMQVDYVFSAKERADLVA